MSQQHPVNLFFIIFKFHYLLYRLYTIFYRVLITLFCYLFLLQYLVHYVHVDMMMIVHMRLVLKVLDVLSTSVYILQRFTDSEYQTQERT